MSAGVKLLLIIIFLTNYKPSFAQKNYQVSKRFGFLIGVDASNMNFNKGVPTPSVPVKANWKSGITMGFLVQVPLAQKLFLQPEYIYTRRRSADESTGLQYTADYFAMPILLNYYLSSRFSMVVGPQPELLIHAQSYKDGINSNITHDTEERSVAGAVGFDVRPKANFILSARYLQGFNHIGIGQRSNVKEFKYEVITLTAGIRF
ncbi:porin family protein [Segetibacter koreensis]|uniref:porin family protein n=1 Tax=Segetibacter koreensis TaxID=398037 RepID=UPI00036912EE|nr:porin family protein [Segetibacter koreensis]